MSWIGVTRMSWDAPPSHPAGASWHAIRHLRMVGLEATDERTVQDELPAIQLLSLGPYLFHLTGYCTPQPQSPGQKEPNDSGYSRHDNSRGGKYRSTNILLLKLIFQVSLLVYLFFWWLYVFTAYILMQKSLLSTPYIFKNSLLLFFQLLQIWQRNVKKITGVKVKSNWREWKSIDGEKYRLTG